LKYPNNIALCQELLRKQDKEIAIQGKENAKQNQEILHLHSLLLELSEEMAKLKNQLGKNSTNSHKPSSTDYFFRKTVAIEPSDKAKGGQTGHIGNTLRMIENPDEIIIHQPLVCTCGENLAGIAKKIEQKRQLFDLPVIKFNVVEHQIESCDCPSCGRTVVAEFPQAITAPVQYGNRTKAFSVLLNNKCQVSFRKIGMVFESIAGQSINQTTLQNANNEAYLALESVEKSNIEDLKTAPVVRADETVVKIKGNFNFIHTVADEKTTHLWASTYRGSSAHIAGESPLMGFKNTVMHDRLPLYNQFDEASHLYCNAHLMRDLQSLCEQEYSWAIRLLRAYRQLYRMSKDKAIDSRFKVKIDNWFDNIISQALKNEPAPKLNSNNGKPSKTESRLLLEFFQKSREQVLAFAFDKSMPFSNNLAEQSFRHVKTKMKVIGGFRLIEGAKTYARCQAVMDTWRKRGQSAYENLKIALDVWQLSPKFA
jgi:transposase-like protein